MSIFFEQAHFVISLLVGGIFSLAGFIMLKFPPKSINHLYGYRTPLSMQSQKHWDYAQGIAAKKMIFLGLLLVGFAFISLLFEISEVVSILLPLILIISVSLYLFMSVERALKKKFPKKDWV
jgi:uncharacterized membrane protein